MKKLFLLTVVASLCFVASAQKVYFLYLQTDDQSPFYVRMSDKIYSSAAAGFLILPNLTDSIYNLNIGFAKSAKPETRFAVTINQNDKGYLIKTFDEGLALFDMENMSIVKANNSNKDNTVFETKSDKFSSILSKAADDPSLLKVPVAKKEEEPKAKPEKKEVVAKVEEAKAPVEKPKDTILVKPNEVAEIKTDKKQESQKVDTIVTEPIAKTVEEVKAPVKEETQNLPVQSINYKPSIITRHSESSTTEGFGIVYFDRTNNVVDTIRILIPPSKIKLVQEPEAANLSEIEKRTDKTTTETVQLKADIGSEIKKADREKREVITSSCSDAKASEKDFMKLRKNMAAKSNDEDMIEEARKSFRNRCFSSEQIRYLSTLFLTPAAKYQFFDAAYTHVFDKPGFSSLQSEIKDEYYLKRFKALIGE